VLALVECGYWSLENLAVLADRSRKDAVVDCTKSLCPAYDI
jgi:hypothetical protein